MKATPELFIIPDDFGYHADAIDTAHFFTTPVLFLVAATVKNSCEAMHIMGLLTDGGLQTQEHHFYAMLDLATRAKVRNA